jgi:DNA helicase HerA-like ATPase
MAYYVGSINNRKIFWDPLQAHNPHLVICGSSGSGKTYSIKQIINTFYKKNITFTVIDKHGDIKGDDNNKPIIPLEENILLNSGSKGINPLKASNFEGGLKSSILSFISLLNELSVGTKLGHEQENMLYNAIEELYYKNQIYENNYRDIEKYPDLDDLIRFLKYKYRKNLIGELDAKDYEPLNELYKGKNRLLKLEKKKAKAESAENSSEIEQLNKQISKEIEILVEKYREYLERGIINDRDFLIYNSQRSLLGLINRLSNINKSGVFVKDEINLYNSTVNIKYLDDEQKKIVTYYILSRIYDYFTNKPVTDTVEHYIVIDEASFFMDVPKITNMIIRIVQEGRKFGLGVILSTQNPLHFHTDILLNTATKIIFAIDPIVYRNVSKSFGVDEKNFQYLKPRQNCLYSTKSFNNGKYYTLERN